jgi:hypothetical protein
VLGPEAIELELDHDETAKLALVEQQVDVIPRSE